MSHQGGSLGALVCAALWGAQHAASAIAMVPGAGAWTVVAASSLMQRFAVAMGYQAGRAGC